MLGIENRICCCYCKRFSSGCAVPLHSIPPERRYFSNSLIDYGIVRWSLLERRNWGVMPKISFFHMNDSNHYDLMTYQKILHTPLSGIPQKCFQSGPALAKAGPGKRGGWGLKSRLELVILTKKFYLCDTRNLRGDYHTLGFNQHKSKLSSVETQNSYVRWHRQQHFTAITENGAFKLRSDIHTPTAPSCCGNNQRFTIEKSREATTHKSPQLAQRRQLFSYTFCLLICRLNANTTEWLCMQISRNMVNGPKSNN